MKNLEINDKVGLSWITGNGNGKVVGIYQDYVMVIHPCFKKPIVVHKNDITPPENEQLIEVTRDVVIQWVADDIKRGGHLREIISRI